MLLDFFKGFRVTVRYLVNYYRGAEGGTFRELTGGTTGVKRVPRLDGIHGSTPVACAAETTLRARLVASDIGTSLGCPERPQSLSWGRPLRGFIGGQSPTLSGVVAGPSCWLELIVNNKLRQGETL